MTTTRTGLATPAEIDEALDRLRELGDEVGAPSDDIYASFLESLGCKTGDDAELALLRDLRDVTEILPDVSWDHPLIDEWRAEVTAGDTMRGLAQYVAHRAEIDAEEAEELGFDPIFRPSDEYETIEDWARDSDYEYRHSDYWGGGWFQIDHEDAPPVDLAEEYAKAMEAAASADERPSVTFVNLNRKVTELLAELGEVCDLKSAVAVVAEVVAGDAHIPIDERPFLLQSVDGGATRTWLTAYTDLDAVAQGIVEDVGDWRPVVVYDLRDLTEHKPTVGVAWGGAA